MATRVREFYTRYPPPFLYISMNLYISLSALLDSVRGDNHLPCQPTIIYACQPSPSSWKLYVPMRICPLNCSHENLGFKTKNTAAAPAQCYEIEVMMHIYYKAPDYVYFNMLSAPPARWPFSKMMGRWHVPAQLILVAPI